MNEIKIEQEIGHVHELGELGPADRRWAVWIEGPTATLSQIDSVIYTLHPSYPNPVREIRDSTAKFRLQETGYGNFRIFARVKFKDGSAAKLACDLGSSLEEKAGGVSTSAMLTAADYIGGRIEPLGDFFHNAPQPVEEAISSYLHVTDLRAMLFQGELTGGPREVTVRGTLFPAALLAAGLWERQTTEVRANFEDQLQLWLFNGFEQWAPSWDFTWNLDDASLRQSQKDSTSYFVAQLGSNDEADSLPVFVPPKKAERLRERFLKGPAVVDAQITALLGHRRHFLRAADERNSFGGLLDYCLWMNDDDGRHEIQLLDEEPILYSGYLWKCVAPISAYEKKGSALLLEDVYFIWEHTNFASTDAVSYNLDGLAHKETYISRRCGDLVLLQKSSFLVPGAPAFSPNDAYRIIDRGNVKAI